jgi:hypothetical protein
MLAARFHYVGDWGTRPMAYRHKLSRRLALLRDLAALAAPTLVGAACERTASLPTTAAPTVAQIVVVPESLTLDPSQQSKFAAYGRLSNGDSAAVAVVWSATGGAIRSDGTYIADTTPGDFQVTATSAPLRLSGSARVRIRPRPAVASVTVAPASATLAVGQTVQLTATPRDSSGAPLVGRSVTWSSGNPAVATVSAAGLVTAAGAGATTITATSEGRSGTASVTVAASSGATVLFQETFEDLAFASRGWYDNTAMTITDTEHIAGSTHALEVHFRPGATTPTWGGAARHLFPPTPTLYVSYWVKYSDNWVGSGRPYHPHEFTVMSDLDGDYDGPSVNYLTLYVEQNYQNGGIPRLALQDNKSINTSYGTPPINLVGVTENRSTCGCNGVVEPDVVTSCYNAPPWYNAKEVNAAQVWFQPAPGPGYKGKWNHVEAFFRINSIVNGIGQPDGVMQYWFNGTLVIDRHDIVYRTGARPTINFHQFLIAPYIGDGSPADQYMWVDDLTVATGRP